MRCVSITLFLFLAGISPAVLGVNPNNSIAPEIPRPTSYGLHVVRSDEYLNQSQVDKQPQPPVPMAHITQYNNLIDEAEGQGGAYAPMLSETLQDLGGAYQSRNDHGAAIDAFKRAIHLTRINLGLYTPAQIPLLRRKIDSHLAAGELLFADQTHEYLYRVQRYSSNDENSQLTHAATFEFAEWQRTAYLNEISKDNYLRLLAIHNAHSEGIEQIEARNPNDPALIPHLQRLLQAEYLLSQYDGEKQPKFQINIRQGNQLAYPSTAREARFKHLKENIYRRGKKLLHRLVALHEQQPDTEEKVAQAKVAIGDWYLWFERQTSALKVYREAYALLEGKAGSENTINQLFGNPIELPSSPVFHSREIKVSSKSQGHAVLSFNVSRHGRAKRIELIKIDPEQSVGARVAIYRMLRKMRFRPRMEKGAVVATNAVVRQYHFEY